MFGSQIGAIRVIFYIIINLRSSYAMLKWNSKLKFAELKLSELKAITKEQKSTSMQQVLIILRKTRTK